MGRMSDYAIECYPVKLIDGAIENVENENDLIAGRRLLERMGFDVFACYYKYNSDTVTNAVIYIESDNVEIRVNTRTREVFYIETSNGCHEYEIVGTYNNPDFNQLLIDYRRKWSR